MTCELVAFRELVLETPDPVLSLHFGHSVAQIKRFVGYVFCRLSWSRTRSTIRCTNAGVTVVRDTGFRVRHGAIVLSIVPLMSPAQTALTKFQRVLVLLG
jgi:hypothetical protein